MENFVQWKFVTECMVPRMVQWSSHGVLWWSIDSNCAIFYLRSFKCSMEIWNWENRYSKLYSRERTYTSCIEKDICYFLYWQTLRLTSKITEKSKIFVTNFLSDLLTYQTPKPEQDDTSAVATLVTLNVPVLSTVFEIPSLSIHYYGPKMATCLF